jgi:hypothetical protein
MHPRVKAVKPNVDYTLILTFTNDEVRVFNVKPYLDTGIFKELKELSIFNSVKPFLGSIQWQNGQDFCPDTLYLDSVSLKQFSESFADEKPNTAMREIKN